MSRKIRFSGFETGVTVSLSASQGGVSTGTVTVSGWKQASAVSVTFGQFPSDPLPGEAVIFWVEDVSGYDGNDVEDLDFEWDFNDAGSAYNVAQGLRYSNANTEYGRVVSHAYTTTGSKQPTVTVRKQGSVVATESVPAFTVGGPDSVAWTKDIWVALDGDFTGAPAAGGAVKHLTSVADLQTEGFSWSEGVHRITLKKGETYAMSAAIPVANRAYVRSVDGFGTGANPKMTSAFPAREESEFFRVENNCRFALWGVDMDAGYDPVTGATPNGWISGIQALQGTNEGQYVSLFRCSLSGLRSGCFYFGPGNSTGGSYWPTGILHLGVSDCDIRDWQNYGISGFGPKMRAGITGTSILQNPLAIMRDPKGPNSGSSATLPEAPDHGPIRIYRSEYFGLTNCNLGSASGWSALASAHAIQPAVRLFPYNIDSTYPASFWTRATINVQRNRCFGVGFVDISTSDSGRIARPEIVIDRNDHTVTRQHLEPCVKNAGSTGVYMRNNVFYYSHLRHPGGAFPPDIAMMFIRDKTATFEEDAATAPIVAEFNTLVSDNEIIAGGDMTVIASDTNDTSINGVTPRAENNILKGVATQANAASIYNDATLDRANNFRPVTGSADVSTVSSGKIPVRDFEGNLRGSPTIIGAHDVESASAGTVDAPSYASGLTASELSNFPGEFHVSDFGTWSNWPVGDQYMAEWEWQLDGTAITTDWRNVAFADRQSLRWVADTDTTATPAPVAIDWASTGSGDADASGFNPTGALDPGVPEPHRVWFTDGLTVQHLDSSSTGTISFTTEEGAWSITGNGDGTYQVTRSINYTGDLTCVITATNRSGQRVSATSNAIGLG